MIAAGLIVLVLGMVWEVTNALRGAWPTGLTWIVMATGVLMTVVGLHRRSRIAGRWGWVVLAALASAAAVAWLSAHSPAAGAQLSRRRAGRRSRGCHRASGAGR